MVKVKIIFCVIFLFILSCQRRGEIDDLVSYWQYREIQFPQKKVFTLFGKDTVNMQMDSSYKIVSYLDSVGCISCKAQLSSWKKFLNTVDND